MIPTMNRPDFLIRFLQYYVDTNYKYSICIGDSSDEIHLSRTKEFINSLNGKLDITHFEYPKGSVSMCLKELANRLKTPYAAIILDDDFIITKTLDKYIDFLKSNPDYSAVCGNALLFSLKNPGAYGDFLNAGPYPQPEVEAESASQRLVDHLSNYKVSLFSIHRREIWQKMFKNIIQSSERAFTSEVIACSLSVVYGKIKHFDDLYLVRQHHNQRFFHKDIYDWLTEDDWLSCYKVFHDSLVEALCEKDGISAKEAHEAVKKGFWMYLSNVLRSKYEHKYNKPKLIEKTKEFLKRIPGAVRTVQHIRAISSKSISLQALLKKRSVYNIDFMPIYNLVTKVRVNNGVKK